MRIVFKVIAIIGVLSFLGGLKNGVFFIFGLILAGIFGYFGWRPEKKMDRGHSSTPIKSSKEKTETTTAKKLISNNQFTNQNNSHILKIRKNDKQKFTPSKKKNNHNSIINGRSSTVSTVTSLTKKKELLEKSYQKGLLTKEEYGIKLDELINQKKISIEQTKSNLDKEIEELLLIQNKDLIDQLLKLLTEGTINQHEFNTKKTEILNNAKIQYLKNQSKND